MIVRHDGDALQVLLAPTDRRLQFADHAIAALAVSAVLAAANVVHHCGGFKDAA